MASTKNHKQEYEKIRQSIAKKYNDKIDELTIENRKLLTEVIELREKTSKQEVKIAEMQDWVERLQDFVNMKPEEFQKYMEDQQLRANVDRSMSDMLKLFGVFNKSFPFSNF